MKTAIQVTVLYLVFLFSCSTNTDYFEQEKPATPTQFTITALSGGRFQITYLVENNEQTFDGYNIYIAKQSTGDVSPVTSNIPYTLDGGYPTVRHNASEFSTVPKNLIIETYLEKASSIQGSTITIYPPFVPGDLYYFKMTAHTRYNIESNPSVQKSAVALP